MAFKQIFNAIFGLCKHGKDSYWGYVNSKLFLQGGQNVILTGAVNKESTVLGKLVLHVIKLCASV